MQRELFYCKSWFRGKKRPTEIWSESTARAAHGAGQPYTVLVDSLEKPYCFLEVVADFVGVSFLDDRLREILSFDFQEIESKKLFLTMATHREFVEGTDQVSNATCYVFSRDGGIEMRREFFDPPRLETSRSVGEVAQNYSAMPEFGEYDDLIRPERD